ncbi:WD40 repeat-like protein [Mycena leptocephala]|nr:WD40 repeat-like protein [Mycena leptocephala]
MSGFTKSLFGKRLRRLQEDPDHHQPPTNRQRTDENVPEPMITTNERRRTLCLLKYVPDNSLQFITEPENALFKSILNTEVALSEHSHPVSSLASPSVSPSTPTGRRLFTYHSPSPSAPSTPTRGLDTTAELAYSKSPVCVESRQLLESPRRQLRKVCSTPHRVLDAPELAEDFYLNLVDWSSTDVLGVGRLGLGSCVYIWNAHNATVNRLCDLSDSNDSISSVSWGSTLAVGTASGRLHVYDAERLTLRRTYQQAHTQRIGAIAWIAHVLTSGAGDHVVHHRDVREATSRPFKRGYGHHGEVCDLKWSEDGGVAAVNLASGGNDNKVCIWDLRGSRRGNNAGGTAGSVIGAPGSSGRVDTIGDAPLWKFHEHTAAVKALAWIPSFRVLATGGGAQDNHIRFWNTISGTMLNELDTGSQVYNLICIWKCPTLDMVASLTGHTNRVLYLAMSPDGETIATGAGDETLRSWKPHPGSFSINSNMRRHFRNHAALPNSPSYANAAYALSSDDVSYNNSTTSTSSPTSWSPTSLSALPTASASPATAFAPTPISASGFESVYHHPRPPDQAAQSHEYDYGTKPTFTSASGSANDDDTRAWLVG